MAEQKSEKPTPRRIQKAREEGNFPVAREFISSLEFLAFAALLAWWGGEWILKFRGFARYLMQRAFGGDLSSGELTQLVTEILWQCLMPLALGGAALLVLTLGLQLATTKMGVSTKKLAPDLKRLNPLRKIKELPRQNGPALVKAAIMMPLFLYAVYVIGRDSLVTYSVLPLQGVESGARQVLVTVQELLWKASFVFIVFGLIDLTRQRRRYEKDLRMSKQDIRDEVKEMEGNPQLRARIRRLGRDRLRRQMMKEVPQATAVVVNPTHFAVAIRYDHEAMAAPRVVAKGKNYLALRIRQKAIEHQVPIIENPPLAQALYKSVDIGQEIPAHLYRAVAEILAYIYRLMNRRF
jgi:flagellar biosynthesis protein FlhB